MQPAHAHAAHVLTTGSDYVRAPLQEFVQLKHRTSWRQQQETEEATRFMAVEGALMECEDM